MRLTLVILLGSILSACTTNPAPELKTGIWRAIITLQGKELPFNMEFSKTDSGKIVAKIINADEKLLLDEITILGDTLAITLHIFDAQLRARITDDSLNGFFIKNPEQNYKLPFKAAFNQAYRFTENENPSHTDFTGKYAVSFVHDKDTTQAVGIFHQSQNSNRITGTFLTATGDYRYLDGNVIDDALHLSAFDGNHAYLFTATKHKDGSLQGDYWSGKTRYAKWTAIKNDSASLPNAESLTYLKEGFDMIDFTFPDVDGKLISASDEKYKNKVVVLQLFGTWCPNCMDETKFLAPWYYANKQRGIEIIGLAYEAKDDFTYASSRVKKMIDRLHVPYDCVIAGTKDKENASKTLPMLNSIDAFPTTIFIGKDGKVKKIHTGFSGPGTGVYYDDFVQYFNETVNELVGDNPRKNL